MVIGVCEKMASYTMYRGRSLRGGRSIRSRYDSEEEHIQIDYNKGLDSEEAQHNHVKVLNNKIYKLLYTAPSAIIHDILVHVVKQGVSKGCKLGYLNTLVKFCNKIGTHQEFGFSKEELFCCLRVALLHEACEVRAAGLRALRYLLQDRDSIEAFCHVQIPFLIARCLDIILDNRIERVQAMRLVRKIISVDPQQFPRALTNCLVAIANDGTQERDILVRACLAALSELALLNPEACASSGGLSAILRNVLSTQQPQISETLLGVILFLLNDPKTRYLLGNTVTLEQILAPLTDCHFKYSTDVSEHILSDDKEIHFMTSKLAILSVLRSWPGLIYLSRPGHAGLQSLIDMLYLPYNDIRKNIMDLLYDIFCLPLPEWTDDFSSAILSSDPSTMQDSWNLYEGFVAAEGSSVLPSVIKYRTNLVENYFALLLLVFVQTGLFESLVEVITCGDNFVSVRATILLGELLHMTNQLLPSECSHHCNCLPSLISMATSSESSPRCKNQASAAVSCLNRIHELKKRDVVPCSLFLDQLLHFCNPVRKKDKHFEDSISRTKLRHYLRKDADEMINQAIKDSQVLLRQYTDWDWDLIGSLLKWPCEILKKLEDNNQRNFIKKLLYFYKPTSKLFSSIEAEKERGHQICIVGCHLIEFLLEAEETKAYEFIDEFLTDINLCLSQVTTENSPLNAVLSPTRLVSALSYAYFLFIGCFSSSNKGRKFLDKSGISQYLYDLVGITSHDIYIKLIVSSLDYTKEGFSRTILTKILTSTSENSRLYATNYMRVLMRARLTDFHKWAIELLVTQLCDPCRAVSLAAADILDEACDVQENLESLISLRPPLLHYGDKGLLLLLRFLSVAGGFRFLRDANFLTHELQKWHNVYNLKYVKIVEDCLNEALTRHRRGEDGVYGRRTSNVRYDVCNAFLPPHMYGQLACHKEGLELLLQEDCLTQLFEIIKTANYVSENNVLHLKAALWAIGHVGMSSVALPVIMEAEVIPQIIKLAQEATVFSVRGTCFYVLGLLSSTPDGADFLMQYGWETVRRSHHDKWPLIQNNITLDEFPTLDDCKSYTWSISSGDSEWLEHFSSSLSFKIRTSRNETASELPSTPSSYSLDLDDAVLPADKQSVKWNVIGKENDTLPTVKTHPCSTLSLSAKDEEESCETRPRSSSDCRTNVNSDYKFECGSLDKEKSSSRPEVVWKIGSVEVIKDRSSSFGGTPESAKENSVKERSVSDLEVGSKKETLPQYSLSTKDVRSCSNESSHTSKSRSGSSTESTTSGISSCDSVAPKLYHSDHIQTLSPIASSTLLNTMSNRSTPCSDYVNRSSVAFQHMSYGNWSFSQIYSPNSPDGLTPAFSFTSARDALGYVTLKDIQRKRIQSMSFDEQNYDWSDKRAIKSRSLEPGLLNCYDLGYNGFGVTEESTRRRPSVSSQSSIIPGNAGRLSDVPQEEVYYIGLCLPVDFKMLLSLHDCKECGTSCSEIQDDIQEATTTQKTSDKRQNELPENGLTLHTTENCLSCKKWYTVKTMQISEVTMNETDEDALCMDNQEISISCDSDVQNTIPPDKQSTKSSIESTGAAISESFSSSTGNTIESGNGKLGDETVWRKSLLYKEVMRFVTNMSSSIALKSSEQGLLNLKQKFPYIFQDICLYTEISLYLANYSFRLGARRFLQELFFDSSFHEIYRDAEAILEITPCVITLSKIESSDA